MRFIGAILMLLAASSLRAEDIHIDLDKPGDPRVKPRVDAGGFSICVELDGHLAKLEPSALHIETRQKGRWIDPKLDAGRYLKKQFDPERPMEVRLESTLKPDLGSGDQRFAQERDAIQREAQRRTASKDAGALTRARNQLMVERISAIRAENVKAGADPRGRATRHLPPLPRQPLEFEKPDAVERILREQCRWKSVADVFQATGFPPPDDKEHPEFAASHMMAEEIQQALLGIRTTHKFLTDGQYNALAEGSRYQFAAEFVPELAHAPIDMLWKTAPAVRLADGGVHRARLEGSLDRQRDQLVEWWRVECDTYPRIQVQMTSGEGDCFWTWVEGPNAGVRYIRVLLHSPGTRYRLTLSLTGALKGQEVTLYDGPLGVPAKAPY